MRIKDVTINNYKSLVDFELKSFSPVTIIYGENNAGKSNVLEFISTVFKRKKQYSGDELTEKPVSFYTGVLTGFNYSFFNSDSNNTISFKIVVTSNSKDSSLSNTELKKLVNANLDDEIDYIFEGSITAFEGDKNLANFNITSISANTVIIYRNEDSKIHTFPVADPDRKNQKDYYSIFERISSQFDDCVFFVPSHRDMLPMKFGNELEETISPVKFKQFLYSLSLNEDQYDTFIKINNLFNSEPFAYGSISFSKIDNDLEIMISKDGIRLPIKNLGSGVLQILYIISCIFYSKKNIICLEELEQNLSPKNQELALKKLTEMLSNNAAPKQLIISSHSPYFYEKNGDNSTYLLAYENGKTLRKAGDGKYPIEDGNYDDEEIVYFKNHFPDVEDFH